MKKLVVIFLALTLAFSCATTDCPKTEVVEKKQKKPTEIIGEQNEKTRQVDELFKMVDRPDSPGAAIGIIKDGKLIYARGYGMANLDHHIPITPKTKFEIASTSKQFTAACIALLYQQGKLDLDDDVRKYLPDLPKYNDVVTIGHLVYHTSGIGDYLGIINWKNSEHFVVPDIAYELIKKNKKLTYKPGDEFFYNNTGYFLLGKIVEKVSGISLRKFAKDNIFKPLGMNDTSFIDEVGEPVENIITPYFQNEKKAYRKFIRFTNDVGPGGVITTIEDFVKWEQNFYNRKIGKKGFHDLMMQKGRLNSGKETFYSFGLMHLDYKGLKTVMHNGSWPKGQNSIFMTFPEHKFSVVIFSNLAATRSLRIANAHKIADIYLEKYLKKEEVNKSQESIDKPEKKNFKLTKDQLEKYTGYYMYQNSSSKVRKVFIKNGDLTYSSGTFNEKRLVPLSENTFKFDFSDDYTITFKKNETDGKMQMTYAEEDATYQAVKIGLSDSGDKDLSKYEGTYYSKEMDLSFKLKIKDGKLQVLLKNDWNREWWSVEYAGEEIFLNSPYFDVKIQFQRTVDDTVSGINFSIWGTVKDLFLKKLD